MLKTLSIIKINSGQHWVLNRPTKYVLRDFAKYAANGFGNAYAFTKGQRTLSVRADVQDGAATFDVYAEGNAIAKAYAVFTPEFKDEIWELARKHFYQTYGKDEEDTPPPLADDNRDQFGLPILEDECPIFPSAPPAIPWVAVMLCPQMRDDEQPLLSEMLAAVEASALGAYAIWSGEVNDPETDEEVLDRIVDRLEAVMPDEDMAVILNDRGNDVPAQRLLFEKQYMEEALRDSGVTLDRALQLGGCRDLDLLVIDSIRRRYSDLWLHGRQVGIIKWHQRHTDYDSYDDRAFYHESDIALYIPEKILRRRFYFDAEGGGDHISIEEDTYTSFSGKEEVDTYLNEDGDLSTPSRTYRNIRLQPSKWKMLLGAFNSCSFDEWGKRYHAPESHASMIASWHIIIRSIDGEVLLYSSGENACEDKHWGMFLRFLSQMGEEYPPVFGHHGYMEERIAMPD